MWPCDTFVFYQKREAKKIQKKNFLDQTNLVDRKTYFKKKKKFFSKNNY